MFNLLIYGMFLWSCLITILNFIFFFKLSFFTLLRTYITFWSLLTLLTFSAIAADFGIFNNNISSVFIESSSTLNLVQIWFEDHLVILNTTKTNFYYIFTISIISLFANYHTKTYMNQDQKKERFVLFLNSFALSMFLMVITKNFLIIFLSWEMLGITSFFLITHNDTQTVSFRSALKAFTYNRSSDVILLVAISLYYYLTGSFNITKTTLDVLKLTAGGFINTTSVYFFLICIFYASSVKSVQFFTHMWLPDSMKAPAPASALIHSATLVASGFYVIILFKGIFLFFFNFNFFFIIGLITAAIGATSAAYQDDIKKTLALSTIANCGFMLVLLSIYDEKIFLTYFVVHGLFKSCSFMFSGNIILLNNHYQDSKFFSNSNYLKILNLSGLIISLLMLSGFPITLTYLIKHYYYVDITVTFTWFSLDLFFIIYSTLSLIYALNIILKVFFLTPYFKQGKKHNILITDEINHLTNCWYSIVSSIVCYILFILLSYGKGFNTPTESTYTLLIQTENISIFLLLTIVFIFYFSIFPGFSPKKIIFPFFFFIANVVLLNIYFNCVPIFVNLFSYVFMTYTLTVVFIIIFLIFLLLKVYLYFYYEIE